MSSTRVILWRESSAQGAASHWSHWPAGTPAPETPEGYEPLGVGTVEEYIIGHWGGPLRKRLAVASEHTILCRGIAQNQLRIP